MSTPTAPYNTTIDPQEVPYNSLVEDARAKFEAGRAALYRADKEPIYGVTEHNARLGDLLAHFDASVQSYVDIQASKAQEADTAVQAVQRDPVKRLDSTEGARASQLAPFFREDFEHLPLAELVNQCQSALARNSAAELALCERYGRRRVEAERAQHPATSRTPHPDAAQLHELGKALDTINERRTPPELAKKEAAAAKTRAELNALRRIASNTRGELDGSRRQAEAQMRARYGM